MFENRPLWYITPKNKEFDSVVLYIHGGAYIKNLFSVHWKLIEAILDLTNTAFVVPDYPLAREATCEDTFNYFDKLMPIFHQMRGNKPFTMMGDSAGGGLTYAYSQYLRNLKEKNADQLILISPWLDITMTNPLQLVINPYDKM